MVTSSRSDLVGSGVRRQLLGMMLTLLAAVSLVTVPPLASAEEPSAQVGRYLNVDYVPAGGRFTSEAPPGLTVNAEGRLVGIPAVAGDYYLNYNGPVECTTFTDPETGVQTTQCSASAGSRQLSIEPGDGRLGGFALSAGNGQAVTATNAFPTPLAATLTDASGTRAADTEVTYTVTSGSAAFPGGASEVRVRTDDSGLAVAPTLTAGVNPGLVTVTVSQPGSAPSTFMLTVTAAGPARADLVAGASAASSTVRGGTLTVTVKIINNGPSAASSAVSGVLISNGFTVVAAPGATRSGPLTVWAEGTLAKGESRSHTITVRAPDTKGTAVAVVVVGSTTADPRPVSNIALKLIKIT